MTNWWQKFRGYILALILGLVTLIDPKQIDEIAARHHQWEALILALWGLLTYWVAKLKPQQS